MVPSSHADGVRTAFPQARIEIWGGMAHHPIRERFDDLRTLITRVTGPPAVSQQPDWARRRAA